MNKEGWRDKLLEELARNQINILKQMYLEERLEARVMPPDLCKQAEDDAERLFERAVDVAVALAFFQKGEGDESQVMAAKLRVREALKVRLDSVLAEGMQLGEELAKEI